MIETTQTSLDALVSPSREIKAKIDLFDGTTKKATFTGSDKIKKFQIERAGEEGKFFGFGVSQKLELELLDKDRELNIVKGNTFDIYLTADTTYTKILSCEVDSIKRDEKTNSLTLAAYDALYRAAGHQVKDLTLTKPYTIKDFCEACGAKLGVSVKGIDTFLLSYPNGANFDGAETLREALDMVAEATQTIYFMDSTNALVFKKLDKAGASLLTIDKNTYFEYKNNGPRVLKTICSTNELGDDVSESGTTGDATQFVRDNAFWELRDDITDLVHNAVVAVGGLSISQFECKWRGNFYLEIGDKIQILGKDNNPAITYLLNDTLVYNGGLNQTSSWKYKDSGETASNPTSIGDAIKQTYARVDKVNKNIELLVSDVNQNTQEIAQLQLDTNNIRASITNVQNNLDNMTDDLGNRITDVERKAELAMTPEQVQIQITEALADGVTSVTTETGFVFNSDGLTISKNDSEISTNIDEDGMSILKGAEEVLTADNTGVNAINLTAHQYLIIGNNSRFEDYGSDRTGCFWIGN